MVDSPASVGSVGPTRSVRFLILLLCGACAVAAGQTSNAGEALAARFSYIPPEWDAYVALYHAFERGPLAPEIDRARVRITAKKAALVPGLTGKGLRLSREEVRKTPLHLHSSSFSPHRPLTVSLWFRLDAPMTLPTCFHLISLRGRGFISNFVRGKGKWCALKRPTCIFQVYHFPGIPNRNNPWCGKAWFEPGEWHNALLTISSASHISVYWDGKLRCHYTTQGRPFRKGDVSVCELGPTWLFHPMTIDEVLILHRALDADEVLGYVESVRRLREVGFPAK